MIRARFRPILSARIAPHEHPDERPQGDQAGDDLLEGVAELEARGDALQRPGDDALVVAEQQPGQDGRLPQDLTVIPPKWMTARLPLPTSSNSRKFSWGQVASTVRDAWPGVVEPPMWCYR